MFRAAALLLLLVASESADPTNTTLRFAAALGDHMVLQQAPAKPAIWGFGKASEMVTVTQSSGGKKMLSVTVSADATGLWSATMQATAASFNPYSFSVSSSSGDSVVLISDILFGDVHVSRL
jgi:sialate O-acetylesterase